MPQLSFLEANLIALALVAVDLLARAWRIAILARGVDHPITLHEGFVINAFGDGACAVTPARLGGEPARMAGLLRSQVPAPAAFVAISYEVLIYWPVLLISGAVLLWCFAPEWIETTGPAFVDTSLAQWPWLVGILLATVVIGFAARRIGSPWVRHIRRPIQRVSLYWRRMPKRIVFATVLPSAINLMARTAILPVLALALPNPPAMGPILLGSFALLYSQLILPTPSGVGGVEFGFLAGAAGSFGGDQGWLLALWRLYTSGIGILLGAFYLVRYYGWPAVRSLARLRRTSR